MPMVDRLYDKTNRKALELVASIEPNDLKKGILIDRLPYFLDLMEKYGLDARNPEHCGIVGRSIEARLENESMQIIQLPKEEMTASDGTVSSFKQFYMAECERIINRILQLYSKFVYNPQNNQEGFYASRNYNCKITSGFFGKQTIVCYTEIYKSMSLFWLNDINNCSHPPFKLTIATIPHNGRKLNYPTLKTCSHIGGEGIYSLEKSYCFYFERNGRNIKDLKRFKEYFELLRELPERLETILEDGIIKLTKNDEKENKRLKREALKKEKLVKRNQAALKIETESIKKIFSSK